MALDSAPSALLYVFRGACSVPGAVGWEAPALIKLVFRWEEKVRTVRRCGKAFEIEAAAGAKAGWWWSRADEAASEAGMEGVSKRLSRWGQGISPGLIL